jgi:hypothetical protein
MKFNKGQKVNVWYRYPFENFPRELTTKVIHEGSFIADAVSRAIAKDYNLLNIINSRQPTIDLLKALENSPNNDILYALTYAAIQPPRFCPDSTVNKSRRRKRTTPNNENKKARC